MAADEEARRRAEVERRFKAAAGNRNFCTSTWRKGLLADFAAALEDAANAGRSDAEVFSALTREKNCFAAQNPPPLPAPEAAELERASGGEAFRALRSTNSSSLPSASRARPPLSGGMSAPRFADIRAPCPAAPARDPF